MTSLSTISGTAAQYGGGRGRRGRGARPRSAHRGRRGGGDAAEGVEDGVGALAGEQHGVATDRLADDREAVRDDAAADRGPQLVDRAERIERAVNVDRLADRLDQPAAGERIGLDLLQRGLDRAVDEVALALRAS